MRILLINFLFLDKLRIHISYSQSIITVFYLCD